MTVFKDRIVDNKLLDEVKCLIDQENNTALKRLIDQMRAADVADLIEHLSRDERLFIFHLLEPEGAGEVLVEIEPPVQERIVKDLDNQAISQ
ncbi:MAG: hypothetical protein H8D55_03160, partial [Deltaproteobacteria bacterium]|nr:hypothetical protein [Deltaproteobacteria bacterium]